MSFKPNTFQKQLISLFVVFLWIPILFFDSIYFAINYFDGKAITSFVVIGITVYMLWLVPLRLKILMMLMIPLSWLGEQLFCVWLNMYDYRAGKIPIYVPFGHAVIFVTGWLLTQHRIVRMYPKKFKTISTCFYVIAFATVAVLLKDTLSLLLGMLFFISLKRKKFHPFYLVMSFLVLYLELVGTYFGSWKWHANQGVFKTVNPPLGAVFFYVGGDLVLGRLTRFLLKTRRKFRRLFRRKVS